METFFKPQVNSRIFTNINNTNNTNNTNDINNTNTNDCSAITGGDLITPAGATGLASLSASQDIPPQVEVSSFGVGISPEVLPELWRGVKLDLFNNAPKGNDKKSLTLAIGIIRKDGTTQSLIAALNSPPDYVWRKVPSADLHNFHWTTVRNIQDHFNLHNIDYNVSKCCLPGKKGSVDIVAFLIEQITTWNVIIVREGQEYSFILPKDTDITDKQREKGCIATKFVGQNFKPLITAKELGI